MRNIWGIFAHRCRHNSRGSRMAQKVMARCAIPPQSAAAGEKSETHFYRFNASGFDAHGDLCYIEAVRAGLSRATAKSIYFERNE